jgi:hypothetical protein
MFRSRTLFVVGAGASFEAGLPLGEELKQKIAQRIDIQFEDFSGMRQKSGDLMITQALWDRCRESGDNGLDINPYLRAAWQIRDAMPRAISIDNYIDQHRGNERIKLCGKLGIAQSIIKAEKDSKIYFDHEHGQKLGPSNLVGTWYDSFFQLLSVGVASLKSTAFSKMSPSSPSTTIAASSIPSFIQSVTTTASTKAE